MRILFATTRGAGHFGPLAPFARACVRAGHEVLVAGPPSVAAIVRRAGFSFRAVAEAPPDVVDAAFAPVWSRTASVEHVLRDLFIGLHARTALPDMLATVTAWRPDVVVRETMEFASAVAAEQLGVPQVRIGIHLDSSIDGGGGLEAVAAPALDELGLTPESIRQSPLLTLAPPSLTDSAGRQDTTVQRFREAHPGRRMTNGGRPLVYVTFGSEAPASEHFPGVYRTTIAAVAELPVHVLVTIGDRRDPAELGPLPPSVRVERWVSQTAVTRVAAAMVGHGGSGSTLSALAAGVPQAFVPLFVDGPSNAQRVFELGAGIVLEGPAEAGSAVRELLGDPRYRAAAGEIAGEIAALPPIDDAVATIQRSAAGHAIR